MSWSEPILPTQNLQESIDDPSTIIGMLRKLQSTASQQGLIAQDFQTAATNGSPGQHSKPLDVLVIQQVLLATLYHHAVVIQHAHGMLDSRNPKNTLSALKVLEQIHADIMLVSEGISELHCISLPDQQ